MLCDSLDGWGIWGKWTCIHMAESLHSSAENITTLLIAYAPVQTFLVFKRIKIKDIEKKGKICF